MKFFAILAVLVAVAAADFSSWTLPQLSDAIQDPNTDPALLPALEQALNDMMESIFTQPENPIVPVDASAPVDLTGWTLHDLSVALQDPATDPALIPYLEHALNAMMDLIHAGIPVEAVGVPVKPFEVTYWSLNDLSEALQNPATNPALIPYLEHALNEMMDSLFAGHQIEVIQVVAPAGLAPAPEAPVFPMPTFPIEELPSPVPIPMPIPTPVVPEPVAPVPEVPAVTPSSPLVQIIVNIKQQA